MLSHIPPDGHISVVAFGSVVDCGLEVCVVYFGSLLRYDARPVFAIEVHAVAVIVAGRFGDARFDAVHLTETLQVAVKAGAHVDEVGIIKVLNGREETAFTKKPHSDAPPFVFWINGPVVQISKVRGVWIFVPVFCDIILRICVAGEGLHGLRGGIFFVEL